ncbi:hypothetical protein ACTXI0_15740 [Arthrobacter rhombi]|uniref:hypothetical protein n=1 Tax=Arthrobacter rhombi TaxID=71253 RepID=UPI003FD3C906
MVTSEDAVDAYSGCSDEPPQLAESGVLAMLGLAGDADESGGNVVQRRMHPRHGDFVILIARLNVEPHVLVDFEPEHLEQAENALKGVCRGGKAQRLAAGTGGQGRISGSAALTQILEGISAFVFLKHGAPCLYSRSW